MSNSADATNARSSAVAGEGSRKRPAVEPASALFTPERTPLSRRPAAVTGGTVLLVLRAVAAALWIMSMLSTAGEVSAEYDLDADSARLLVGIGVGFEGAWMLLLVLLAWLVHRGSNAARMLVLFGATTSILVSAIDYFATGEDITVRTTLLTLALDILILVALSSRDARAWSRRI